MRVTLTRPPEISSPARRFATRAAGRARGDRGKAGRPGGRRARARHPRYDRPRRHRRAGPRLRARQHGLCGADPERRRRVRARARWRARRAQGAPLRRRTTRLRDVRPARDGLRGPGRGRRSRAVRARARPAAPLLAGPRGRADELRRHGRARRFAGTSDGRCDGDRGRPAVAPARRPCAARPHAPARDAAPSRAQRAVRPHAPRWRVDRSTRSGGARRARAGRHAGGDALGLLVRERAGLGRPRRRDLRHGQRVPDRREPLPRVDGDPLHVHGRERGLAVARAGGRVRRGVRGSTQHAVHGCGAGAPERGRDLRDGVHRALRAWLHGPRRGGRPHGAAQDVRGARRRARCVLRLARHCPPIYRPPMLVTLRPLEPRDGDAVHDWARLPESCRYQAWGPNSYEQSRAFVEAAVAAAPDRRVFAIDVARAEIAYAWRRLCARSARSRYRQPVRAVAIVNDNARRLGGRMRGKLERALPGSVRFTGSLDDARTTIRTEIKRGCDLVVLGGGDGTVVMGLTLIAEACRGYGRPAPAIAILRLGSGNAVADTHGATDDVLDDLARLSRGAGRHTRVPMLDVLGVRAPFVGVGVDALLLEDHEAVGRIVDRVPVARRLLGGASRYALAVALRTEPRIATGDPPHAREITAGSPAIEMSRAGATGRE